MGNEKWPLTIARSAQWQTVGADNADQRRHAAMARSSRVVGQLLSLAQVETRRARTQPEPIDPVAALRDILADFTDRAARDGTELALIGSDQSLLSVDRAALRSILDNLIDKALRNGGKAGFVCVEVILASSYLTLTVSDRGPGIPPENWEQAFERFWRAAAADVPGAGLGPTIVRQYARTPGGRVRISAADGGHGCRVTLSLPSQPARASH